MTMNVLTKRVPGQSASYVILNAPAMTVGAVEIKPRQVTVAVTVDSPVARLTISGPIIGLDGEPHGNYVGRTFDPSEASGLPEWLGEIRARFIAYAQADEAHKDAAVDYNDAWGCASWDTDMSAEDERYARITRERNLARGALFE